MTSPQSSASAKVWEGIDAEKRRDRLIKRVSVAGWSITVAFVIVLLALEAWTVLNTIESAGYRGDIRWDLVLAQAMPGVIVLGFLSALVATLATVTMIFRRRSATLSEIQLRLAALEDMITRRAEG